MAEMVDQTEQKRKRRSRLLVLLAIGSLAMVSLGSGIASLALFTSGATVPGNTFTAGTVVLGTSPTSALITYTNMAPGDQVTAPLTVSNTGSLDLRYAATTLATNSDGKGLAAALVLTVKAGVTSCTDANWTASGTVVYGPNVLGPVVTAGALFGDPATGDQAGDRPLTATSDDVLCFHVALPLGTGDGSQNYLQGSTTTATFQFYAEQTKNN
jgi:predicted ribosomally synthesized peptide with SipW-like signal peptide